MKDKSLLLPYVIKKIIINSGWYLEDWNFTLDGIYIYNVKPDNQLSKNKPLYIPCIVQKKLVRLNTYKNA